MACLVVAGASIVGVARAQHSVDVLPASTIRMIQHSLMQGGYQIDATDGIWGPKTEAAMREFQKARGLPSTGNPDEASLAALGVQDNEATSNRRADAGPGGADQAGRTNAAPRTPADLDPETIVAIQRALDERGVRAGRPDGIWGERTESALADLQRANGLAASGQLDARTLTLLGLLPGRKPADGSAQELQADPGLDPAAIRLVQQALGRTGQQVEVDGNWGPRTTDHLREFQRSRGLPANGEPDVHTLAALGLLPGTGPARVNR